MSQIPNGPYIIQKEGQSLTSQSPQPGAPVTLLPPTGQPGEQEWHVQRSGNGAYTIQNIKNGKYIGFEGDPEVNEPIVITNEPKEWELHQSDKPFTYFLVLPGGPISGGQEVAIDLSLLRIFPPRLALRPFHQEDDRAAWQFRFLLE